MHVCVRARSEEHTSELQSYLNLVCRLLLEKKKKRDMLSVTRLCHCDTAMASDRGCTDVCAPVMSGVYSASVCVRVCFCLCFIFFFNDTATTEIYTLSLHDALPICLSTVSVCVCVYVCIGMFAYPV